MRWHFRAVANPRYADNVSYLSIVVSTHYHQKDHELESRQAMPDELGEKIAPRRAAWLPELRAQVAAYLAEKGLPVRSTAPYVLAGGKQKWPLNIIEPQVVAMIRRIIAERRSERRPFPLHRWIRHGLSSQALLFNLIGPVLLARRWDAFDAILESAGIPVAGRVVNAELEEADRSIFNELQGQPTSVDLYLHTDRGDAVCAELKFTEAGFGGCSLFESGDCEGRNPASEFDLCYLHAIGRTYWLLMQKHGLITDRLRASFLCPFVTLYQAYRLLIFSLEREGHFLLIHDDRNPSFAWASTSTERGAFGLFYELLPTSAQTRCHRITTQQVVEIFERVFPFSTLDEVKAKYL